MHVHHARPCAQPPTALALRAAVPDDRDALAEMLSELSLRSAYLRFFTGSFRVTPGVLDTLLCVRGTGRAFVAVEGDRVVGHAMWATTHAGDRRVEIAFLVAADRRGRGVATRLTRIALADAAGRGFAAVEATVLAENPVAQRVVQRLLPRATRTHSHGEITYTAPLDAGPANAVKACRPLLGSTRRRPVGKRHGGRARDVTADDVSGRTGA